MLTEYVKQVAEQTEAELKEKLPSNAWSGGYIQSIIELCCKGDDYFFGHHGAFDAYLKKRGLTLRECPNCEDVSVVSDDSSEFCSSICKDEYYGAY